MRYWAQFKGSRLWTLTAAMGILLLCASAAPAVYMDGFDPSGHWKLDENKDDAGFSGYLNEITALRANCATGGCPTTNEGVLVGNSLFFDGTNEGIDVAHNDLMQFAPDTSWSVEYWMRKPASTGGAGQMVVARNAVGQQLYWWVGVSNDDKARFYLVSSNDPADPEESSGIKGTSTVTDGEWHHIVAVKQDLGNADGSTQVMLYVDGVLETSESTTFINGFQDDSAGMTIGYMDDNGTRRSPFSGSVDDVAVYKLGLDEDTIRQHYINGKQGYSYDEDAAPAIVISDPIESLVGYPFTLDVDAVGNPVATYELVNAPAGMDIDAKTGVIDGALSAVGDTEITVRASSTAGQDEQAIPVSGLDLCTTDLMAHWTLDEDGSDAAFSGFANKIGTSSDGTCVGACSSQTAGQVSGITGQTNYAQAFSGAQGIDVEASDAFNWDLGNSFTIAFWMQRDGNPDDGEVIIGRDEQVNDMHWWVGVSTAGQISFWLLDSDGIEGNVRGTKVVTDNTWHHVAAVLADQGQGDGSAELRLYVDGKLESSLDVTYTGSFRSADRPLNIGYLNHNGTSRRHFTGQLDEIAIYHRAFSDLVALQHVDSYPARNYCNSAPEIDTEAPITATEGQAYSYAPTATDEEEDSLTWSLDNAPSGMTIDDATTGVVSWTPAAGETTSGAVTLTVDDGFGGEATETFTIAVSNNPSDNHAPSIDGQVVDPISMVADTPRAIALDDLNYSDQDSADTVQLETVADGEHYTVSNFTITPEAGYTGPLTVAVTVSDGQATSNTFNLNIVVVAADAALQIMGDVPNTTINAGETFTYNPSVANPQSFDLTWELSNQPDGMTADPTNGVVSWTPAEGVTTSDAVTLTVTGGGESDTVTFTVTVNSSGNGGGGGGGGGGCFIGTTASGAMSWSPSLAAMMAMLTALSAGMGMVRRK